VVKFSTEGRGRQQQFFEDVYVTLSASEGSLDVVLSIGEGLFAKCTLTGILRSLRFLRMTRLSSPEALVLPHIDFTQ
jgi:hypothetical protein